MTANARSICSTNSIQVLAVMNSYQTRLNTPDNIKLPRIKIGDQFFYNFNKQSDTNFQIRKVKGL